MNHLKEYVCEKENMTHLITFADNNAVGYFAKQGFTKDVMMPREKWVGYIKEYDGGTIMECHLSAQVSYTDFPVMIREQRRAVSEKVRELSTAHLVHPGLKHFEGDGAKKPLEEPVRRQIPGLRDAGWTPPGPPRYRLVHPGCGDGAPTRENLHRFMRAMINLVTSHQDAWPFLDAINPDEVPDYYDVVKDPVYVELIKERASRGGALRQPRDVRRGLQAHVQQLPPVQRAGHRVLQVRRQARGVLRGESAGRDKLEARQGGEGGGEGVTRRERRIYSTSGPREMEPRDASLSHSRRTSSNALTPSALRDPLREGLDEARHLPGNAAARAGSIPRSASRSSRRARVGPGGGGVRSIEVLHQSARDRERVHPAVPPVGLLRRVRRVVAHGVRRLDRGAAEARGGAASASAAAPIGDGGGGVEVPKRSPPPLPSEENRPRRNARRLQCVPPSARRTSVLSFTWSDAGGVGGGEVCQGRGGRRGGDASGRAGAGGGTRLEEHEFGAVHARGAENLGGDVGGRVRDEEAHGGVHEGDARSVRALAAEPLEVEGEQRVVEPVPTGEEGDVAHAKQRVAVVEHLIVHVDVERARRPAGAPPRAPLRLFRDVVGRAR